MPAISAPVLGSLKDPIMGILRKSDLSSVSAKSVRQALINLNDPRYPSEKLLQRLQIRLDDKEQKKQIDELIRTCFDDINNPTPPSISSTTTTSSTGLALPTGNGSGQANGHSAPNSSSAAPKLALPGMGGIPGSHAAPPSFPSTSSSNNVKKQSSTTNFAAGGKRSRKAEADTISDDEEDADAETIRKKVNASTKKKPSAVKKRKSSSKNEDGGEKTINPNNPFNKPVILSEEMSKICGGKEMPRYMITKQLWAYIKERDLQNPANKRQIMCDPTLQNLFGKATVDSFEMAKLISNHVTKKDP